MLLAESGLLTDRHVFGRIIEHSVYLMVEDKKAELIYDSGAVISILAYNNFFCEDDWTFFTNELKRINIHSIKIKSVFGESVGYLCFLSNVFMTSKNKSCEHLEKFYFYVANTNISLLGMDFIDKIKVIKPANYSHILYMDFETKRNYYNSYKELQALNVTNLFLGDITDIINLTKRIKNQLYTNTIWQRDSKNDYYRDMTTDGINVFD